MLWDRATVSFARIDPQAAMSSLEMLPLYSQRQRRPHKFCSFYGLCLKKSGKARTNDLHVVPLIKDGATIAHPESETSGAQEKMRLGIDLTEWWVHCIRYT